MTAAARGIKGIIRTIDQDMIEPVVKYRYYRNIQKVENAALVGDYKVKAIGSSSLIAKEQQAVRRSEFMRSTQNHIDYGIMGPDGRTLSSEDTARALELDPEKAVPEAPPQPPQAAVPPGSAQPLPPTSGGPTSRDRHVFTRTRTLEPGGQPVAGQDFNLHKNQPQEELYPLDKRIPNPMLQPADEVLKSIVYLSNDPNFQMFVSWVGACYGSVVNRTPTLKDEVELRWNQGQCQALLLINKALTQARDELLKRKPKQKKTALSRNPERRLSWQTH